MQLLIRVEFVYQTTHNYTNIAAPCFAFNHLPMRGGGRHTEIGKPINGRAYQSSSSFGLRTPIEQVEVRYAEESVTDSISSEPVKRKVQHGSL